jgi:hypothetical protein
VCQWRGARQPTWWSCAWCCKPQLFAAYAAMTLTATGAAAGTSSDMRGCEATKHCKQQRNTAAGTASASKTLTWQLCDPTAQLLSTPAACLAQPPPVQCHPTRTHAVDGTCHNRMSCPTAVCTVLPNRRLFGAAQHLSFQSMALATTACASAVCNHYAGIH